MSVLHICRPGYPSPVSNESPPPPSPDESLAHFVEPLYHAYGEAMWYAQSFEHTLKQLVAQLQANVGLGAGKSTDEVVEALLNYGKKSTLSIVLRDLDSTTGLEVHDGLQHLIDARNFLAHEYLTSRAIFLAVGGDIDLLNRELTFYAEQFRVFTSVAFDSLEMSLDLSGANKALSAIDAPTWEKLRGLLVAGTTDEIQSLLSPGS